MTWWDDLAGAYEEQRAGTTREFITLMLELWHELQQQGDVTRVATELEKRARLGVFYTFELAGRAQLRELAGGLKDSDLLTKAAETLALRQGALARERALAVLGQASLAQVSPYARLAAGVLVMDALRTGLQGGATLGGATHKRFTRIRGVKEPRSHSVLEGVVKRMDEPYIIAGIPVHGPGAAELPWSEKAWCGHALEYLRLNMAVSSSGPSQYSLQYEQIREGVHAGEIRVEGLSQTKARAILRGATAARLTAYLRKHPLSGVYVHDLENALLTGFYNPAESTIHLNSARSGKTFGSTSPMGMVSGISAWAKTKEEAVQITFVHELGHHIVATTPEVIALVLNIRREAVPCSRRASVSTQEYFCETLAAHAFYAKKLMQFDPAGYKMIQEMYSLIGR